MIPNWNGRDLLAKYLPSVIEALGGHPGNEIIVVDNGSEDGSAEFLRERFPSVRVLALDRNLGFGGGSNARVSRGQERHRRAAEQRHARGARFPSRRCSKASRTKPSFSVACQIFFSDPNKLREETGLTQFWWENGSLRVRHRDDPAIQMLYPCAYGGGGSCAFDRRKFLELGGFDELLAPFYMEDTDVGYLAWKRGWKVLYQPRSVVYHEHRGTIGKTLHDGADRAGAEEEFRCCSAGRTSTNGARLGSHFFFAYAGAVVTVLFGDSPERANFAGLWRAFRQLPESAGVRGARARSLAVIDDTEAFRRPLGGYFRDRFAALAR